MAYYEPNKRNYIDIVVAKTGLDPERTINSLTTKEFESFCQSIEFVEGWTTGREDFIEKWIISGVHKKNGTIFEYAVRKPQGNIWLNKKEALALASEGKLHAVIVHLKNGTSYLRPKKGSRPFLLIT